MASTTIKKLLDICLAIQLGIVGYFYFDAIYKALTYGPPKSGFGLAGVPVAIYTAAIAIVITPFIVTEWQSTKGLRGRVFLILCLPGVVGIPLDDLLGSPY